MILTDGEIEELCFSELDNRELSFARAIEAAVLSKLAEQAGEPAGKVTRRAFGYVLWATERPELGTKLYTETQLIAAQQRTAEACAKLCEAGRSEDGDGQHRAWYAGFDMCIDAIRNGDWREYL